MTVYGYRHIPQRHYFADVRYASGATSWAHVRTNLGRKAAYAMIAKHFEGCKIERFRDEDFATAYDREGLAQGSDGALRSPSPSMYGNESHAYGPW